MLQRDRGWAGAIAGAAVGFLAAWAPAFGQASIPACRSDDDCKAPRQCEGGRCVDPAPRARPPEPVAPPATPAAPASMPLCTSDSECRGARVCERGRCIDPLNPNAPPVAPVIAGPAAQPAPASRPASPPASGPALLAPAGAATPARPLVQERGDGPRPAPAVAPRPPKGGQRFVPPNVVSARRLSRPAGGP